MDDNLPFRNSYYLYKTLIEPCTDQIEDLSMPSKELHPDLYLISGRLTAKELFVYLRGDSPKLIGKFNTIDKACELLSTDYKMIMSSLEDLGVFRSKYLLFFFGFFG